MPKIALDVDDTLAATTQHVCAMPGTPILPEWNFENRRVFERFIRDVTTSWSLHWARIPPVEPNQAGMVRDIAKLGTVDMVTVGFPEQKARWLRLHGIRYNAMASVDRGEDKAELDYDVFVDDSPDNFQAFSDAGKPCVLFDAPHNQDVDAEYRVTSLGQAAGIIEGLFGGKRCAC